jgi:predicted short-subunit dehydrogenase-like oxidoreductase (DUF2520 family)
VRGFCGDKKHPDILPPMIAKPSIAIVGPGRLGGALARALNQASYRVTEVVYRDTAAARSNARALARITQSRAATTKNARLDADVIWLCVSDREIACAARSLASATEWKGKMAFHCSGALSSDELAVLRKRGASVASVHPLMTFVHGLDPSFEDVPFGVEGAAAALRMARRIVHDLGGNIFRVPKDRKAAYHAWGTFLSPLLVSTLVTAEQVARAAGFSARAARKNMLPIVRQTLANYARLGPAKAFSGPLARGDAAVVQEHLQALEKIPEARRVYVALARAALRHLPVGNRRELRRLLEL